MRDASSEREGENSDRALSFSPLYSGATRPFIGCPGPCNISASSPFVPLSCDSRCSIVDSPSRASALFNGERIGQWRDATVTVGRTPFLLQPPLVRSSRVSAYGIFTRARVVRPPCQGQGVGQLASDGCAICTRGTPPFSGSNGPEGSGEIKKDRGGGSGGRRMLRAASLALGSGLTTSLPTFLIVRARWPSVPRHCR